MKNWWLPFTVSTHEDIIILLFYFYKGSAKNTEGTTVHYLCNVHQREAKQIFAEHFLRNLSTLKLPLAPVWLQQIL